MGSCCVRKFALLCAEICIYVLGGGGEGVVETGVCCGRTKWKGRGGSCVERAEGNDMRRGALAMRRGGLRNDGVLNFRSDGNRPFNELSWHHVKCVGWCHFLDELR